MKFLRIVIFIILSFSLFSCGKNDGVAPSSPTGSNLFISPKTITLAALNHTTFTTTGGSGSYSYSIFSGTGSVLFTTGYYTAPASSGSCVVRVTDSSGQFADAIVTINNALQISPTNQSLGLNATQTFSTTGGVGPITFSIFSGVGSVNSTTGVYTAPGAAGSAVVRAKDSLGNISDASVSIFASLGISPTTPSISINGSISFSAAGGATPYVYSILSGGGSINSASGVYTAPAAAGSAVVRVTDSLSNTADANVTIVNLTPVVSNISNQTTNEDTVLPVNFTITDADSTLDCVSSMSASSSNVVLLPVSNIVFSGTVPNCVATLTPVLNQNGTSNLVFTVSDGVTSATSSFAYTANPVNDPPTMSSISAQTTNEDTPLVVNFTIADVDSVLDCVTSMTASTANSSIIAVGGIVFSGTAPNCSATISPSLNQNGVLNLTFRVSDSEPLHMDQTFSVTVNPVNDAPTISNISAQNVKSDGSLVVNYTIADVDNTLDCSSSVTTTSSVAGVLPNTDIVKGGTVPNCTLTITPSLNVAGVSNINVTVSDGSLTASSSFNLTVANVTSVAVSPASLNLAVSATSQLTAVANYSDSSSASITTATGTAWSSSNAAIATVNNSSTKGLTTGVAPGSANMSFTYKSLTSNNAAVSVISATSVTVSAGAVSGGIGSQAAVFATAQNSSTSFDVTSTGVWSTSNSAVATVANGVISYLSAGSAVITVTYAGLSATVNVTVLNKSLISIAVMASGGGSSLSLNGTKDLIATGTYSDSSTDVLTSAAVWTSSNLSVLTLSNSLPHIGRATGVAAGTSTVTATVGSISGNLLMTVNSVTLSSIAITPYDPLVATSGDYGLHATGTYSDASTADVTDLVTWASSNGAAATVSNVSGASGVATTPAFAGYKTTNITATLSGITGTTPFGVNGANISSIIVTPIVTITPAQTYQLKSYGNLTDGGVIDLTDFSIWSSSVVTNVSVSNSLGSKGLVTGVANGTSNLMSQFGGVSGTRTVTVAGASALTDVGVGLTGMYYTWTGSAPPASPFLVANRKGQRIDAQVNFTWTGGNGPMGVGTVFSTRWTGFYKATTGTNYFCTYTDDGVRVWVNGVQIINNWTEHSPTWNCSANIALTAGTKYAVIVEYYQNGGGAEAHLTRSSVSAVDAQNIATKAIQQVDLYPF